MKNINIIATEIKDTNYKILLLLVFSIFNTIGYAQTTVYDSLSNISKENYLNLKGEVLVSPKSKYIWPNLFWTNTKGKIYHKYKHYDGKYYSEDKFVLGKNFLIEDIVQSKQGDNLLKSKCLESGDIIYINCYFLNNPFPPFYIRGYFEKAKETYLNSYCFVYKSFLNNKKEYGFDKDTEDNKEIIKMKCVDVSYVTTKNGIGVYLDLYGEKSDKHCGVLIREIANAFVSDSSAIKIREDYKNRLYRTDVAQKFMGKKVYYGLKEIYTLDTENEWHNTSRCNKTLRDSLTYQITEGFYDCVDFRFFEKDIAYAILKDNKNILFRVPVYEEQKSYRNVLYRDYKNFTDYFILEEEAYSILAKKAQEKAQKEHNRKVLYDKLLNKYGKTYAEEFADYPSQAERFEQLVPKYGKSNAKLMVNYRLRIGWTDEMVRISWGAPDRINTTTSRYGVHEQWVYKNSDDYPDSYLYFEDGILTTIQD